uniref:LIM zinc-binding domain-containing protein n=1 Tax=Monopterus albus TaxID=43700 RepID=A0A3Q3R4Z0_MONAL
MTVQSLRSPCMAKVHPEGGKPPCIMCYEALFSNKGHWLHKQGNTDVPYKNRHWHGECFLCFKCSWTLCYSNEYSAKCHVCLKTIMPGSKKMEYEGNSWSFVQKDGNNYYMPCCEKQFSLQCVHCKPITTGGVNYCDQPWHKEWLVCTGCKYQLADQWLTSWDDFAFCLNCSCNLFAKKCVAVEGEYISFEQWRSKCFNCKRCCVSLVGQGFLTCKDNILCTDCGKDF